MRLLRNCNDSERLRQVYLRFHCRHAKKVAKKSNLYKHERPRCADTYVTIKRYNPSLLHHTTTTVLLLRGLCIPKSRVNVVKSYSVQMKAYKIPSVFCSNPQVSLRVTYGRCRVRDGEMTLPYKTCTKPSTNRSQPQHTSTQSHDAQIKQGRKQTNKTILSSATRKC